MFLWSYAVCVPWSAMALREAVLQVRSNALWMWWRWGGTREVVGADEKNVQIVALLLVG